MRVNAILSGLVPVLCCVHIFLGVLTVLDSNHCLDCADIPSCVCEESEHEASCPARLSDS